MLEMTADSGVSILNLTLHALRPIVISTNQGPAPACDAHLDRHHSYHGWNSGNRQRRIHINFDENQTFSLQTR